MEYILYADINDTTNNIGDRVIDILNNDNVFGEVGGIKVNGSEISCYCDVFTLFIDNESSTIKCIVEDSKQSLNVYFYMNLNTRCEDVVAKTIYFVGRVMEEFSGNVVLMQNGDTPIVMRKGGEVIVDKSKVVDFYPFEMLRTEYKVNNLDF